MLVRQRVGELQGWPKRRKGVELGGPQRLRSSIEPPVQPACSDNFLNVILYESKTYVRQVSNLGCSPRVAASMLAATRQTPHHPLRCKPLGSRSKCYETWGQRRVALLLSWFNTVQQADQLLKHGTRVADYTVGCMAKDFGRRIAIDGHQVSCPSTARHMVARA